MLRTPGTGKRRKPHSPSPRPSPRGRGRYQARLSPIGRTRKLVARPAWLPLLGEDALNPQLKTAHAIVPEGGGHFVLFAKGNQGHLLDQAKHFLPEDFSTQLRQVERGHGRMEWRGLKVRAVTPVQMGFPHVLQVARLARIRELKGANRKSRPFG